MIELKYTPDGEIIKKFMKDNNFFRGLRGPVGSGKSVACCIELFRRALMQKPNNKNQKKSRWAVIRNTNPQLRTTTIKTWLDWFPENEWGRFIWSVPYTHRIQKGNLDIEVIFLALDRPEDVKKLLSLELTGVWINEAREIPKSIIDACSMRVGRYPSVKDVGASWFGVICDTNAPDEDHWWSIMSGDAPLPEYIPEEEAKLLVKPDIWSFYNQPSAMIEHKDQDGLIHKYTINPKTENHKNLNPAYYKNIIMGKSRSWIDVYIMNRLGTIESGKSVYSQFNETTHISSKPLAPIKGYPIWVGLDFGLTPAAVFAQRQSFGKWIIFREIIGIDIGAIKFAEILKQEMSVIGNFDYNIYGDPAGEQRAQTDETTPFQILRAAGVKAIPAPTNDITMRTESVNAALTRMQDGKPCFKIDKRCVVLIKGFNGGYQYRRMNVVGDRYEEKPNKNRYSHVHDALQYLFLGAGEGRDVLRGKKQMKPFVMKRNFDVFKKQHRRLKGRSIYD